jgi:DNA-binding MarR family transcriptional regulator
VDPTIGPAHEDTTSARFALSHEFIRYHRVIHAMKSQLADVLPAGLDPAAAQLLSWLVKQGPSRQGALADETFLDPSTVSRRISQLVQQGLVERRADPEDGRAVQLVPTAQGQTFFSILRTRREEMLDQVLANWTRAEVTALSGLLQKFNDDFEDYRSQAGPPLPTDPPPLT